MGRASASAPGPVGRHGSTDVVTLQVVRMAIDETWSPRVGANRLLGLVDGDVDVLRRARARVLREAGNRSTGTTERALVTLDLALRTATLP
jgi:hypothetical protein